MEGMHQPHQVGIHDGLEYRQIFGVFGESPDRYACRADDNVGKPHLLDKGPRRGLHSLGIPYIGD